MRPDSRSICPAQTQKQANKSANKYARKKASEQGVPAATINMAGRRPGPASLTRLAEGRAMHGIRIGGQTQSAWVTVLV
jgi:hypothetical protein